MAVTWLSTPVDVTPGSTGSWVDVDNANVPDGAAGVILGIQHTTTTNDFGLRKNGSTDNRVEQSMERDWAVIGVDASGIFECYTSTTTANTVILYGYFDSNDESFFTNAPDKSLGTTSTWTDVDVSSDTGGDTATGVFVEGYYTGFSSPNLGIRKNGSSDSLYRATSGRYKVWQACGVDGSEIYEAYTTTTDADQFLIGYTTGASTWNTNATDYSIGTSGAYTDLSNLPSGATAGVFLIDSNSLSRAWFMRKNGASIDLYSTSFDISANTNPFAIIEAASLVVEGYIEDTNVDFYLVGYFEAGGASAALTGTATGTIDESDVVTGGKTIILTLTGDTWVASGATFDAQRQNIIDGITSAQSETTGWNNEVRDNLAVTTVVRTSDTVVTVTLSAQSGYEITAQETITVTIPATALVTSGSAVVASPTFTVDFVSSLSGTLDFLQSATSASDTTTYTFSSQSLGAADSGRYIIVTIGSRIAGVGTTTINSVTIGGVSATITRQQVNQATNTDIAGIAIAAVPTGTTGDIVVTFNSTMLRCVIAAYRVVTLSSVTAYDSDDSTANPPSVNLDIPDDGFAIGTGNSGVSGGSFSWTGLTEDSDDVVEFLTASSASDTFVSGELGRTITATPSSSTNQVGVFASWAFQAAGGTETASVSPVTTTLTPVTPTATYSAVTSASVSPVSVTLSPVTPTATYIQVETTSVSPISLTLSQPEVTAEGLQGYEASVSPVSLTLVNPSTTATYQEVDSVSVSPVTTSLSVVDPTATYVQVETASVSPVTVSLTVVEQSATFHQSASVSPVSLTLNDPGVTASYEEVDTASVSPFVLSVSEPGLSASYVQVGTASVSPIGLTLSQPEVTGTYSEGIDAVVSPLGLTVSVPQVTAYGLVSEFPQKFIFVDGDLSMRLNGKFYTRI